LEGKKRGLTALTWFGKCSTCYAFMMFSGLTPLWLIMYLPNISRLSLNKQIL